MSQNIETKYKNPKDVKEVNENVKTAIEKTVNKSPILKLDITRISSLEFDPGGSDNLALVEMKNFLIDLYNSITK